MLKNYKKIVAFGASVTEQENGYADQLAKKIGIRIKKFGYGGMHLPDAGVCFIDKVLSYKPDLVLIDWFSTGYMECSEKTLQCIDTILYKFSKINCFVIFLILPGNRSDERYNEQKIYYNYLRNALKIRNAFYIDIDNELKTFDLSDILRDSIHTTIHGGAVYAEIIKNKLYDNSPNYIKTEVFVANAKYKEIKCQKINRIFNNKIKLQLDGEIIGIYNTIGRNSGICKIFTDDGDGKDVLLWDRWCHYERNHFDFSIPEYHGKVIIQVLQDVFDTSSCKLPIDFSNYKKHIMCREIYWQGKSLYFENVKEGSMIEFFKI